MLYLFGPPALATTLLSCLWWTGRITHTHHPAPLNAACGMTTAAIMLWSWIALICAARGDKQ